jgi:pimeloyl-ACP methyl ester carboxylesterase
MIFTRFVLPLTVLFVAIFVGIIYLDRQQTSDELAEQFSHNLKKWHDKGNYFMYKNIYKVFYVFETLHTDDMKQQDKETADEATTLVFLHGFPTSSYDYIKLWNLFTSVNYNEQSSLNKKYTAMLAFDFIGFGFSDKPADYDYSLFDAADLTDKLLMHLNINKVAIISHDMADSVAEELLRRDNLNNQNHFAIDKCVLFNGGIFTDIYKPVFVQHVLRSWGFKDLFATHMFKYSIFSFAFSRIFGSLNKPNSTELYDFYLAIRYNRGNEVLPRTIGYMDERDQYGETWRDALNETTKEVMFVYGPADPINPRSTFPAKIRTELPNVKLSVLSELVGHYPQFEDPFTVCEIIKKFLR